MKDQLIIVKLLTENFSECIAPRDLSEMVASMCFLKKWLHNEGQVQDLKNLSCINFDKELRLLAKKSALMLSLMSKKSRDIVVDHFEMIDFYDPDFTEAMKRAKMIR